jgi:aldose 1-epimerase
MFPPSLFCRDLTRNRAFVQTGLGGKLAKGKRSPTLENKAKQNVGEAQRKEREGRKVTFAHKIAAGLASATLGLLLLTSGPAHAAITAQDWGVTADDGRPAQLFTLTNAKGLQAKISNYGGVLVSLMAPDRNGKMADVVQGFSSLADYTSPDYLKNHGHYGAIIGRFANRIRGGKVTLDGKTYALDADASGNHDQGGEMAYFRQVFRARTVDGAEASLVLSHTDPDGFMGFPGTVQVTITYTLTRDNALRIDMRATTDKKTVINLTNHSYFNLSGAKTADAHSLQIFASHFTPLDPATIVSGAVPSGEIRDVTGSDFDFRKPVALGPRLNSADPQIAGKKGLDHSFVVDGKPGTLRIAARMTDPASGRVLEVWTTQPGVQVYSSNSVRPKVALDKGYVPHGAISFQTLHYPDSPNHPNFPSTELAPGKPFHEVTEFRLRTAP